MKSKHILIIITLVLMSLSLWAEQQNSRQAIGFHFGATTGSGYSMRWMGEKHGIQVSLGAYTTGDNSPNFSDVRYLYDYYDGYTPDDTLITVNRNGKVAAGVIGINYLYTLDHFRSGRLYLMSGGAYKYYHKKVFSQQYLWGQDPYNTSDSTYVAYGEEQSKNVVEHRWTVGVGPGFELALGKQFRLSFEIPITYNWKDDIAMSPQLGIYYYFK